jgi:nucleoporin p58/p45
MAFATNSAAFGIKSSAPANTSTFGAPKPPGSLFGGTTQQTTGSSFTPPSGQQPAQSSNLFGGGFGVQNQQQPQQPASTGMFGQPVQQQQQQPASTGLFGQPQQPASTGLFGQPAPTGMFGQSAQQQPQQPAASTSIFGQPTQQQQSTGLFGQPASTGMFGQPAQQQPQQQPSIFGQPSQQQQQPQQNPFGSSLFGNTVNYPSASLSTTMQPTGPPQFTKSTKFNDLPDELKKVFETIDSHIQGRVQISKELQQLKLGEQAIKGQEALRAVRKELVGVTSVVRSDVLFTRDLKAKTDQAVQDTIIATGIVDGFRNPQQSAYLKNHATFPLDFFTRITVQMKERLQWYKSTIEQIERKLSSTANQMQTTPQAISATLQAQHATFIALASKTATLDAELQKIKALYTQLWRQKTGSMRDPFHDLDRNSGGDFGFESLHVK